MWLVTIIAFSSYGIYHYYTNYPQSFETVKNEFIWWIFYNYMKLWSLNEQLIKYSKSLYIKLRKLLNIREKVFTNKHINKCNVITYELNVIPNGLKTIYNVNSAMLTTNPTIFTGCVSVVEIIFDNSMVVNYTLEPDKEIRLKEIYDMVELKHACGYPTPAESPMLCVEVAYDNVRYDITLLLKNYLYATNVILCSKFVRMIMYQYLDKYIHPNETFVLHTIDRNMNFKSENNKELKKIYI